MLQTVENSIINQVSYIPMQFLTRFRLRSVLSRDLL